MSRTIDEHAEASRNERVNPERDDTIVIPAETAALLQARTPWAIYASSIAARARWHSRSEAEHDDTVHQLIPVVVLTDTQNRLITFRRRDTASPRLAGRRAVTVGGHPEPQDQRGQDLFAALRATALREMAEETDARPLYLPDDPECVLIDRTDTDSARHIAVVYRVPVENLPVTSYADDEFDKDTEPYSTETLREMTDLLDPWTNILVEV